MSTSSNDNEISLLSRVVRHGILILLVHVLATLQAVEHRTVSTEVLVVVVVSTLVVAVFVGELGMIVQIRRDGFAWPFERSGPVRWRDLSLLGTVVACGISGGSPGLVISGREWLALAFGGGVAVGVYGLVIGTWSWRYRTGRHAPVAEGPDEVDQP